MTTPINSSDDFAGLDSESLGILSGDTGSLVSETASIDEILVWLTPRAPLYDALVPTAHPAFSFTAATMNASTTSVTLQLQIAEDSAFTANERYMQFDVTRLDGVTLTTVGTETALDDDTEYYWRLRQVKPLGQFGSWTSAFKFTTALSVVTRELSGSFTVTSGQPTPHLWFINPTRVRASEDFTLYGQGFGQAADNPTVVFADLNAPVADWTLVPAGAEAYTANRVIDALTREITVEHGELTATPGASVEAPGGPAKVAVEGEIPDPPTPALWYMAEDVDPDDTTQWPAHSGSGPTLTGGVADFVPNALNGRPGIDFGITGAESFSEFASPTLDSSNLRVFYAAKLSSSVTTFLSGQAFGAYNDTTGLPYIQFGPHAAFGTGYNAALIYDENGTDYLEYHFSRVLDAAFIAEWQYSPLVYKENEIEKTPIFTDEQGPPSLSGALDYVWVGFIGGLIYEVIVYDSTLSSTEEDQIYAYFTTRYEGDAPTGPQSNSQFVELIPEIVEQAGWEIKVYSHEDFTTEIAIIPRFSRLVGGVELSGVGSGEIEINLDDIIFNQNLSGGQLSSVLIDEECLWKAFYNGVERFSWFNETPVENIATEGSRKATITGPGSAEALSWAVVLPKGFPQNTVSADPLAPAGQASEFPVEPVFKIWRALLAEAQTRGTVSFIETMFSDAGDSGGVAWADTNLTGWSPVFEDAGDGRPVFKPKLGRSMLQLLQDLSGREDSVSSTILVDWLMRPGFKLDVRKDFGSHLEDTVIFHIGGAVQSIERTRIRKDVKNVVVVRDDLGNFSVAVDNSSISKFHRRELLEDKSGPQVQSEILRPQLAELYLTKYKNERSAWTIRVQDKPGRKVFENYNVGDWVGIEVEIGTVDTYRVLAITIEVNEEGKMTAELILQSRLDLLEEELERQIQVIMNTVVNEYMPNPYISPDYDYGQDGIVTYNAGTGGFDVTPFDSSSFGGIGGAGGGFGSGGDGGIQVFIQPTDPGTAANPKDFWFQI